MDKIAAFLHRKLDNFSFDEYLIMFVVCTIFLPFYCSIIAIIGVLLYLTIQGRMKTIIQSVPRSKFAIGGSISSKLAGSCLWNRYLSDLSLYFLLPYGD